MKARWAPLGIFLLLAFLAAFIGGLATASSVQTWYPALRKPSWTPPSAVFGPVWTVLYILMSIATWRVWRDSSSQEGRTIVRLFSLQLVLNALWSILFFGLRQPGWAVLDIVVLWLVLLWMFVRFRVADRIAATLWAPYVAWVSFAAVLNTAVWEMNR